MFLQYDVANRLHLPPGNEDSISPDEAPEVIDPFRSLRETCRPLLGDAAGMRPGGRLVHHAQHVIQLRFVGASDIQLQTEEV